LDFGSVTLGNMATQTVTVSNGGIAPLNISAINLSGSAANFSVAGTCAAQVSLVPPNTCTIAVTYTPTAVKPTSDAATVNIGTDTAPIAGSIALTGKGTAPPAPQSTPGATGATDPNAVAGASTPLTNTGMGGCTAVQDTHDPLLPALVVAAAATLLYRNRKRALKPGR
jgi:hypothetical protein